MSSIGDEDLLGGEDDFDDGYDITDEKEEALLQGDDDFSKPNELYHKKTPASELEDQGDILNLDIEEDFRDVDDKLEESFDTTPKDKRNEKFLSERLQSSSTESKQNVKKAVPLVKKQNNENFPKKIVSFRNDNRRRGIGRVNSQSRNNFAKNNNQRRRNGTVLINPRYEGTVSVNTNARLAWDSNSTHYPPNNQQNFVQPWATGDMNYDPNPQQQLVNNLPAFLPPTTSNYFPPPVNDYQPSFSFEPPPSVQASQQQYNPPIQPFCQWGATNENQVSRGLYPPTQSNPHQPRLEPRTYNDSNYDNYYNTPNHQVSYNQNNFRQNDFEPKTKNNNYNSNSQKDFYNKNSNYSSNNFHRRNSNNNNVATSGTYTSPNIIRILGGDNQGQNYTTSSSHTIGSQNQNKKDYNKPSTVSSVKRNNQEVNKNSNYQRNLKTNVHSDTRPGLPDKKLKLDEYGKKSAESNSEKTVLFDEDDEETRRYRQKIEEQKKERERILQIKEERRKQMLLQRKKEEQSKLPPVQPAPKNFPKPIRERTAGTATVQDAPRSTQNSFKPRSNPPQNSSKFQLPSENFETNSDPTFSSEFSNLTFKINNEIQESHSVVQNTPKTEASNTFMSNRVVIAKSDINRALPTKVIAKPTVSKNTNNESSNVGPGFGSFFNNRTVLTRDNSLLYTKLVTVNNLSTNINQNKLMAWSRGIGEIEKLRVDRQKGQATILFKSVPSAHAFYKKYHRKTLDDLSMIEVRLEPMI